METYPGSSRPLRSSLRATPTPVEGTAWDSDPVFLDIGGRRVEFFHIGALARALNRRPNTMRKWLTHGVIPPARFRTRGATVKGSKRLWTRAQIEGIVAIADEEGVLVPSRHISPENTDFPARCAELFRLLRKEEGG